MKAEQRCIFLAVDGTLDLASTTRLVSAVTKGPAGPYLAGVKFNDVLDALWGHLAVAEAISVLPEGATVFLDPKLADIADTNRNRIRRYFDDVVEAPVVTISIHASPKTFVGIRQEFPGVRVAVMGVPTDWTAEECIARYGEPPDVLMQWWLVSLIQQYKAREGVGSPAELVIASFDMLVMMGELYPQFGCITPGIRDEWMLKGGQERVASTADALRGGASYLVMGTQLLKGNPDAGISAEESQRRTAEQVKEALGL